MDKIQLYGTLHKQIRDHEDEITMTFKCSASEFDKAIGIPTQTLLVLTVELCPNVVVNSNNKSPDADGD